MLKLILLLIAFLCIGATEIEEADQQWLQTSEDVMQIAELGIEFLKNQSEIHAFDDIRISKILQNRKTLAGSHRSVFLKFLITSMHFYSSRAEESISMFAVQKERDGNYSFYIPKLPVMKESFLNTLRVQETMEVEL
ncbi:hypothetical protein WA171_001764 [Blastocystis sp. BT1]